MSRSTDTVTWEKSARKGFLRFRVCVVRDWLSMFSRNPPPPVGRRGCALCPRRRVEPCGTRALGGGASALLQLFAARCSVRLSSCCRARLRTRRGLRPRRAARTRTRPAPCIRRRTPDGVKLPSNLVAYQAPTTTSTTAAATTTTTAPPTTTTTAPAPTTTTTTRHRRPRRPPRRRPHRRRPQRRTAKAVTPRGTRRRRRDTAPVRRSRSERCSRW